jgi:uncharacterized protein YqjF (DUF2071 family)
VVTYDAFCPFPVERPAMLHRWDQIAFLHWKYDTETVQRMLPDGLVVEEHDGHAWVGLIPFFMKVRIPPLPRIPWLLEFPETNVRTYVRGPSGESGVWFFSLEAARLSAVLGARATYRVPYYWAKMRLDRRSEMIEYTTRRRWPGPRGIRSVVGIEIGEAYRPEDLTEFDHFLTARWTLYGTWGGQLLLARAQHSPWPLHRARVYRYEDEVVQALGLPAQDGAAVVHWSPGVDVRIGYPERID